MKNYLFLFLLFAATVNTNAQNWLWKAGSQGNDAATDVAKDASGNIYTTGYFSSLATFGNNVFNTNGQSDVFIMKSTSGGNLLWAKKAGGPLQDKAFSIATDAAGNSYITGTFTGISNFEGTIITAVSSSQDIFIAKYDTQGNLLWVKTAGGSETDISSGITVDGSGNAYITGQFKGTATFDNQVLTSTPDTAGVPTYDIFIAKYSATGSLSWIKQGAAQYDDRGLSISADGNGFIYATGEFSDTLNFTNSYNNNSYNSGYLLKLDYSGNELWFKRFTGGVVTCNDVSATVNNHIYVTGDFVGNLTVSGPPYISTTSAYSKKIFIARFNNAGDLLWLDNDGSGSTLSSRAVCADANGNAYITGNFKCTMNEYSDLYGTGIFNSVGYNDIYVTKYSETGQRQWVRQLGGPGEDRSWGIFCESPDNPVICGSFNSYFNAPGGTTFTSNAYTQDISSEGANAWLDYCSDTEYGIFRSVASAGQADVLLAKPIDLSREPYDYFERTGTACERSFVAAEIVPDTVFGCDSALVHAETHTGASGRIGPGFNFDWSINQDLQSFYVYQSGNLSVNIDQNDGCRSYTDSVYVLVVHSPPVPVIESDISEIVAALPDSPCLYKLAIWSGSTAHLTVPNLPLGPGYEYHWETPNGIVNTPDVLASVPGSYVFVINAIGASQCAESSCVDVYLFSPADSAFCYGDLFIPELHFVDSIFDVTDTVRLCFKDVFEMVLTDSAHFADNVPLFIPLYGDWTANGGLSFIETVHHTFGTHTMHFKALTSGICTVSVTLLAPPSNIELTTVTRIFYLDVITVPPVYPVVNAPLYLCPGDTAAITTDTEGTVTVSGPGIISHTPDYQTVLVNLPGTYVITATLTDSVLGCTNATTIIKTIDLPPPPPVFMTPSNGIICPYDSVLLSTTLSDEYDWYGPDGNSISHSQSVYAYAAGIYFCITTDNSGCVLVSEPAEVREYSTPYLESDGQNSICAGQDVSIHVITLEGAEIEWEAPISGNASDITVSEPGTYSCSVTLCGITTSLSIVIDIAEVLVDITVAGPDTICEGQTTLLSTIPGMSIYEWSGDIAGEHIAEVDHAGIYTVTVTTPDGCIFTSDPVEIFSAGSAPEPLISADTTICAGQFAVLTAVSDYTVYWYLDPEGGNSISTGSQFISDTLYEDITLFAASFDSTCFSNPVPVNVFVSQASLPPVIYGDSMLCTGDTLTLSTDDYFNTTYTWTGPDNFTSPLAELMLYPATQQQQGIYTLSVSDAVCSSPASMIQVLVGIIPVAQIMQPDPAILCLGDSVLVVAGSGNYSYVWQGISSTNDSAFVVADGAYFVIISDSAGCTDISDTLHIHFNPLPTLSVMSDTMICMHESITIPAFSDDEILWYSDSVSSVPVFTGTDFMFSALENDTVIYAAARNGSCSGERVEINVHIHPLPDLPGLEDQLYCHGDSLHIQLPFSDSISYIWAGPAQFYSDSNEIMIAQLDSSHQGIYNVEISVGACQSPADSFSVFVNLPPVSVIIPTTATTVCEGGTVSLQGEGGYDEYLWLPGLQHSAFLNTDQSGNYFLVVTDSAGCSDTSAVEIVTIISPPTAYPAIDTLVCENQSILLTVPSVYDVTWFNENYALLHSGNSYTIPAPADAMVLHVRLTDTIGCYSQYSDVNIDLNPMPAVLEIEGIDTVCINGSVLLSTEFIDNAVYTWTLPADTQQGGSTITIGPVNMSSNGYYTVTAELNGCEGTSAQFYLTVLDNWPAPEISGPDTVCIGNDFTLSTEQANGNYYTWVLPDNSLYSGAAEFEVENIHTSNGGNYELFYTRSGCPSDTAYRFITVGYIPLPNIGSDTSSCIGTSLMLSLDSIYPVIIWNNGYYTQTAEVSYSGLYWVVVHNEYGCVNSDSVAVEFVDCNLSVTNIITPNGDGINDEFIIDSKNMNEVRLWIYNRFGRLIYKSEDKGENWDGTDMYNGKTVSDGTYFYILESIGLDNLPRQYKGFIQVIN
ncbi:MAG: gliding motility-associated C-terminal domain-containing protein [Bacteroidia bacterium]